MRTTWLVTVLLLFLAGFLQARELSLDEQREIIQNYMYITGQSDRPSQALADARERDSLPVKCGTPFILEFHQNLDKLDPRLMASMGVQVDVPRPQLQFEYGTVGGHTAIHYDKIGINAVWQADVDSDGDGVPNYVERLASIADSCWHFIFDSLGYPHAIDDSPCTDGGDDRIDIYLVALPSGYYGLTYGQWGCNADQQSQTSPAWIEMDNDFQQLPDYIGNPLPAAQVTIAHEMFHTSHFAMDGYEHPAWFEMSAVWMEEQKYDQVNDYYLYDYIFFDNPAVSIVDTFDNHQYQSVVFPIFLSEKYGRDIIKSIWQRAAAMGKNRDFLRAANFAIDSAGHDPSHAEYRCDCYSVDLGMCLDSTWIPQSLATAMTEFAVWNYFTGPYAHQAPNGYTYSEAEFYDQIPLSKMDVERVYPVLITQENNRFAPQPNAATYLRLDNLEAIESDTLLSIYAFSPDRDSITWGVAGIFQYRNNPDSHLVVTDTIGKWGDTVNGHPVPGRYIEDFLGKWVCTDGEFDSVFFCDPNSCLDSTSVLDLRPFRSATIVFVPSTVKPELYVPDETLDLSYQINNFSVIDQSRVDLPGAVLTPYPNPAVVGEMSGEDLKFRFQSPTDTTSFPIFGTAYLLVDLFTVSGERVRTIEGRVVQESRDSDRLTGVYEVGWDMKNEAGKDVASGVYLAVARLYVDESKTHELAEDRVKVAVIR